jgi:hypothetical protein
MRPWQLSQRQIRVHYPLIILLSLSIYIYGFTTFVDLGLFFTFLILYTVGRVPWTRDQPVARPLSTHRTAQTQNKRTQTSKPEVGFEPTIPVFERMTTVHALDRAANAIGWCSYYCRLIDPNKKTKVELFLCLTKHQAIKIWANGVIDQRLL